MDSNLTQFKMELLGVFLHPTTKSFTLHASSQLADKTASPFREYLAMQDNIQKM